MADDALFVSRVARLPLVDSQGTPVARVEDVVIGPSAGAAPHVTGFVASVQRRRIFVNAGRVGELSELGVRLRSTAIDVEPFRQRPGELLAVGDLLDRQTGQELVYDIGLKPRRGRLPGWDVATVALGPPRFLKRRRAVRTVGWAEVPDLWTTEAVHHKAWALRELHAADAAAALASLPAAEQIELAEQMEDEFLAEMLEELPEDHQVEILESLDVERAADVLEEMDPDDAADVLAEMPRHEQDRLLEAMVPEEAEPVRRLLAYGGKTAGGLMTPEPVILEPETTVAEALARLRDPELPSAHAAQVFVAKLPTSTPTGVYLGMVGIQRLLREPPAVEVGDCVEEAPDPLTTDATEAEVAARLATYDLLAVPVCDAAGRLVGAVTVDDVLDHLLPEDWRG